MKYLSFTIFCFVILCSVSSCKTMDITDKNFSFEQEAKMIEQVMKKQEKAWSEGNIEEFMKGYWNSEKLSFGGNRGFTFGYDQVMENYKKGYPTKEIMGILTFDIIDIVPVAETAAYVLGKYSLEVKDTNPSGYFTLVFRKINGEWKIVTDHTSG